MPDDVFDRALRSLLLGADAPVDPERGLAHVKAVVGLRRRRRQRRVRWLATAAVVAAAAAAVAVPLALTGGNGPAHRTGPVATVPPPTEGTSPAVTASPTTAVPASGSACTPNATATSPGTGGATTTTLAPDTTASTSVTGLGVTATYTAMTTSPNGFATLGYPGQVTVAAGTRSWTLPAAPSPTAPAGTSDAFVQFSSLCLVQFATAPEPYPSVLLEGFTGGAHCCMEPTIYAYDAATGAYTVAVHLEATTATVPTASAVAWDPNQGFVPVTDQGVTLLKTGDGRFPYALGCYACTPSPVRLFTLAGGRLTDVTSQHPALVESQIADLASSIATAIQQSHDYLTGSAAAWLADQCVVGRGASNWSQVVRWGQAGYYASDQETADDIARFLLGAGYCAGQIPTPPPATTTTSVPTG